MKDGQKPHNKPQYGEVMHPPVLVLIVVPLLLLLLPLPLLSSLFMFSSPLSLLRRVYTVFYVSPFLPDVMFWVELMSFPSKLVTTPVSYTSSSTTLLLHAQERGNRGYLYSRSRCRIYNRHRNNYFRGCSFCCVSESYYHKVKI